MTTRIAINGMGRIGRLILRALLEGKHPDLALVAVNDLGSIESLAHLLKWDSVHGPLHQDITFDSTTLCVADQRIAFSSIKNPCELPWAPHKVDIIFECTGKFTTVETANLHLQAGAKRVLISAPSADAPLTIVYGVNHSAITRDHTVISNASCTTNCLAPLAMVMNEFVGIKQGFMTTIHAYTGDQSLVDTAHRDPRRARAAALSMIPSSTGAAKSIGKIIPALEGKLDGTAIRVPVPNVSAVDFTFVSTQTTTVDSLNKAFEHAAQGPLKGILATTHEPLVSVDFNHSSVSATIDLMETKVLEGHFCRILAWYDNEWGFSHRMLDVASHMGRLA